MSARGTDSRIWRCRDSSREVLLGPEVCAAVLFEEPHELAVSALGLRQHLDVFFDLLCRFGHAETLSRRTDGTD
jgi:hypothetical protein